MSQFADCSAIHDFLMKELRLLHVPVGIQFFFDEAGRAAFGARAHQVPRRSLTFCQAELGARMSDLRVLLDMEKLSCKGARYSFGVHTIQEKDVLANQKFCKDEEQTRAFLASKPRLEKELLAVGMSPLGMCDEVPDVVHFCCNTMQAHHLVVDWMAVSNVHPLRPALCMNSAMCGGIVFSYNSGQANLTLTCGGSYNSGKMERGEVNVMLPGNYMQPMAERMAKRIAETGGVSITRQGHPFPGADICKNCPMILFKEGSA